MLIPISLLGQSGCRLVFQGAVVYVDPYLSNSAQVLDSPDLQRQVPIAIAPEKVDDADWVLITHAHIDHCDPYTLPKLAIASPDAHFVGPAPVIRLLTEWGIAPSRLAQATETGFALTDKLTVRAIPAAHPEIERDRDGNLACIGFLLDHGGRKLYIAGDTFVRQEIIDRLRADGPVHTAILPVNEHNFFRARRGIIGNMSVREAFQFASEIGASQFVAMHWDMFAVNSVHPDEIRLIHQHMKPRVSLLLRPDCLNLGDIHISLIIRTLNEARHLGDLLQGIAAQQTDGLNYEVVLVDSGSTDGTLEIAERHGCRILHITREEFSFGRSLNMGCAAASGDILAITSGHCVPADAFWLQRLCQPLLDGVAQYSYGRQFGGTYSHFSERRIFAKYFPDQSKIPQVGFYCNNANSALLRSAWERYRFDEELTGLEDMEFAQRLVKDGGKLAYVAEACVYHHHSETWPQVRRRFEREAIALRKIMPQVYVGVFDTLRYIVTSIWKDWRCARQEYPRPRLTDIARYRWCQYWGAWKGNHQDRKLSHAEKEKYFFPH